ncbi:MAG: L,D-transpeptidase family protein [Victivallaceae bacterium]|nr:L,D-transpeptidase family protein [Victivallaceae bacterium]
MAKIGYSFNGGRQAVKPRHRRGGGGRFLIIFIILLLICGGIYYMFLRNENDSSIQENNSVAIDLPQTEEKVDISELRVGNSGKQELKPTATIKLSPPVKNIELPAENSKTATAVAALCAKSISALSNMEYTEARQLALKALQQPGVTEYSVSWIKAAEALSQANSAIINSDIPLPGKKVRYKVVAGDALQKIANKFNTTVEFIQRGNRMKKNNYIVWEGQGLKIYHGNWHIKISKKNYLLSLYDGDELFRIYHIGIGKQDRTPESAFTIVSKKKNPTWYKSKSEIFPFGTKENVLGTRWLALKVTDKKFQHFTGYGIHGTWDNDSIGKAMSNGCIRMKNAEVEELFAIVPYRTEVVIGK